MEEKKEPQIVEPTVISDITSTPPSTKNENKPGGDVTWALFLIFVGGMLFLNTTGVVSWAVWPYLLRFWPVFLIFAGIQVIFGKFAATRWIISILSLLTFIILGVTAIAIVKPELTDRFNIHLPSWWISAIDNKGQEKQETSTVTKSEFSADVKGLYLNLHIGVGAFSLMDAPDMNNYFTLTEKYFDNFGKLTLDAEPDKEQLAITVDQESGRMWNFSSGGPSYEMTVDNQLPTDVNIDLGAGKGSLELMTLPVRTFKADIGAGQLTVDFSEQVLTSVTSFTAHVGAGKLVLAVPEEVGLEIKHSVGVGSIRLDNEKISDSDNDTYQTTNYDQAQTKVSLTLDVGVGSIEIIYK